MLHAPLSSGSIIVRKLRQLLTFFLFLSLPAALQAEPVGSISGRVIGVNAAGASAPVAGAFVSIRVGTSTGRARTDLNGEYRIPDLLAGDYELTAHREGFDPAHGSVTLEEGGAARLDFRLTWGNAARGTLDVRVLSAGGSPLPQARVTIEQPPVAQPSQTTDETGLAIFNSVEPRSYSLRIERSGFRSAFLRSVRVRAGMPNPVTVRLRADLRMLGSIVGRVTSSAGGPVPGASVVVVEGLAGARAVTDREGRYLLKKLPPGDSYVIQANARGFAATTRASILVQPQQSTVIDLVLLENRPAAGGIAGRIKDGSGHPIPFARVEISAGPAAGRDTQADAEGRYELSDLPPASNYGLLATSPGFSPAGRMGLIVAAGMTAQVDLRLQAAGNIPGTLEGAVTDVETGQPLPGVVVEIIDGPTPGVGVLTGANGRYRLGDLPPSDRYGLRFSLDGYQLFERGNVQVRPGESTRLDVELRRRVAGQGGVTGTIKKPNGRPLDGAEVVIFLQEARAGETRTDARGAFEISGLRPGAGYSLRVKADGYETEFRRDLVIPDGTALVIDVSMRRASPAGGIGGQVLDLGLRPISGATVSVVEGPGTAGPAITDSTGRFVLSPLPEGSYTLRVTATGRPGVTRSGISVTPDRVTSVTIQMVE